MLTLPDVISAGPISLATLLQYRIWLKVQVLLVSTMLALGQRMVAAAVRVMGLSGDCNYAGYHHVVNRAARFPL